MCVSVGDGESSGLHSGLCCRSWVPVDWLIVLLNELLVVAVFFETQDEIGPTLKKKRKKNEIVKILNAILNRGWNEF